MKQSIAPFKTITHLPLNFISHLASNAALQTKKLARHLIGSMPFN
jgi:hypothetical protein